MEDHIREIKRIMVKHKCSTVICAGDIFHKWNSPPELVNFAIEKLPKMYAIPGNHDLPEHNYADIHKSSYWTLVMAGVVRHLPMGEPVRIHRNTNITGFPEGLCSVKATHLQESHIKLIHIAIVHDYCWMKGHSFPGCPKEKHVSEQAHELKELGFTAGVFGDNHRGFLYKGSRNPDVLNVGGFIRRNSDEKDRILQIGLLYDDGTIGVEIVQSEDEWEEEIMSLPVESRVEVQVLMEALSGLKSQTFDFGDAVRECIKKHNLPSPVRRILLRSIEK